MSSINEITGKTIVIMGVSGAGKSTIGKMLGKALSCDFLDADDFHSLSNKDKMSKGIALSDEDRFPWLQTIQDTLRQRLITQQTTVLACSSLKKQYREILRGSDPDYSSENYSNCKVKFVLLEGDVEVIAARLRLRAADGEHFMASTLLQSQFDLLQVEDCEEIIKISVVLSPEAIVNTILQVW